MVLTIYYYTLEMFDVNKQLVARYMIRGNRIWYV